MNYRKQLILLLFCVTSYAATAQESKQVTIEGKIGKPTTITLDGLKNFKSVTIDSVVVYNHLQQRKGAVKNLRGVLLKDLLAGIEFSTSSPKLLSEFYLTCIANDNYKVVYSWNELFNTDTGNHTYVVTDYTNDAAKEVKGSLSLITTTDKATGRRFVKGLSKIVIQQVN